MLIKCNTNCACQVDGYCVRAWQEVNYRDRKLLFKIDVPEKQKEETEKKPVSAGRGISEESKIQNWQSK
jgi:hypothetical protein